MRSANLLRWGGVTAWLMVGAPLLFQPFARERLAAWSIAFTTFGVAYALHDALAPGGRVAARLIEVTAVVTVVLLLCNGFEGTLLVLIALQLGNDASRRTALFWIGAQTLLLFAAIAIHWSLTPALMLSAPYLGFQILACLTVAALRGETDAREEIARQNAELRATASLLADSSRIAERLRVARELHDSAGHHLGALSLHLEAALQRSEGAARDSIATARHLASALLEEIREIVATTTASRAIDVGEALRTLVANVPRPAVHLVVDDAMSVDDPERAHVVIRCVQEIVTNTTRHANASNLWLAVTERDGEIRIEAHDDGRGASSVVEGVGLTAMRERLVHLGGRLRIMTNEGAGFATIAVLPGVSR